MSYVRVPAAMKVSQKNLIIFIALLSRSPTPYSKTMRLFILCGILFGSANRTQAEDRSFCEGPLLNASSVLQSLLSFSAQQPRLHGPILDPQLLLDSPASQLDSDQLAVRELYENLRRTLDGETWLELLRELSTLKIAYDNQHLQSGVVLAKAQPIVSFNKPSSTKNFLPSEAKHGIVFSPDSRFFYLINYSYQRWNWKQLILKKTFLRKRKFRLKKFQLTEAPLTEVEADTRSSVDILPPSFLVHPQSGDLFLISREWFGSRLLQYQNDAQKVLSSRRFWSTEALQSGGPTFYDPQRESVLAVDHYGHWVDIYSLPTGKKHRVFLEVHLTDEVAGSQYITQSTVAYDSPSHTLFFWIPKQGIYAFRLEGDAPKNKYKLETHVSSFLDTKSRVTLSVWKKADLSSVLIAANTEAHFIHVRLNTVGNPQVDSCYIRREAKHLVSIKILDSYLYILETNTDKIGILRKIDLSKLSSSESETRYYLSLSPGPYDSYAQKDIWISPDHQKLIFTLQHPISTFLTLYSLEHGTLHFNEPIQPLRASKGYKF